MALLEKVWAKRFWGAAAVVASVVVATPEKADAQEIQLTGPLKGAPAVRQMRLYREGRFMIAPTVTFTLLDEYRRAILIGGKLHYNIKEWLSIGVWGAYGVGDIATDLTNQIDQTAPRDLRTAPNVAPNRAPVGNNFTQQTARMVWVANPEVQFTPFRGKLAIFQKIFVDADAYLHAGAAFIGLNERGPCGASGQLQCSDPGAFAMVSRVAIAPSFGLGLSFYPADFISIGIEYRAIPFAWNRAGFDTRGGGPDGRFPDGKVDGNDATFAFNQFFSLQVGFFPQKRGTSE